MASSTKIIKLSICMIISTFGIVVEAYHHNVGLEPLLAAGVITLLLNKNKGGHGYSGRAQSYEHQQQPLQHNSHHQQLQQNPHHHRQAHQPIHNPAQQAYEQAVQGHGPHEHEANHGSPRFEMPEFPYDSSSPNMYAMPRNAGKGHNYKY